MVNRDKLLVGTYAVVRLLTDETVGGMVGAEEQEDGIITGRIYPSIAPEDTETPFMVYERDAYQKKETKMGVYNDEAEVVYEVVADDYEDGLTLAIGVVDSLQGDHGGYTFKLVDSAEFYKENKFRQQLLFKIT